MEILIGILAVLAIGWAVYRTGKRTGSIKGFGAGFRRGRRITLAEVIPPRLINAVDPTGVAVLRGDRS